MKKIAFEEHFTTREHLDHFRLILDGKYPVKEINETEKYLYLEIKWLAKTEFSLKGAEQITSNLLDTSEGRLKIMDETGIDMQVLSLVSPGVQVFDDETARKLAANANNDLAKIIKKYPKRFTGLAALAPQDPKWSATELERAVKELGLKGASVNAHTRGEYLDDKKYWVIYEKAEKLGVPIYIHPRMPSPSVYKALEAYPPLSGASMGYGMEVDIHARRLIYSGVFNKYPKLKFILGHMGEAIPYWLWRLDNRWMKAAPNKDMPRKPSDYFINNFMITTSGSFSWPALLCAYLQVGADNILFAVDFPFESSEEGVKFIDAATICEKDKEKICHINAEKILGI